NDTEGHRQRQGDGGSHQHGRTPVPETDQGDDHDEDNGLIETAHQQTDKLLHLPRLVRRASYNKVGRQLRAHIGKGLVDCGAKLENLLPRSHLHGQGDGTITMPRAVRIASDHIVQVPRGRLICTRYVHKIAQIKRCSSGRRCEEHVANIFRAFELRGYVNQDVSRLGLDDSTWSRHIPRVQDVFDFRGLQFQCCQPRVRVLQIDLFGQNADALHLRDLWYTLQRALDQVGEVIKLPIRIPVIGYFRDSFFRGLRIANDNGTPRVGMKVVFLQPFLNELLSIRSDFVIRLRRRKVDSGAASYGQRTNIVREPVPVCLRSEHDKWPLNHSRGHGCRVTVENGDASTRNSSALFLNRIPH